MLKQSAKPSKAFWLSGSARALRLSVEAFDTLLKSIDILGRLIESPAGTSPFASAQLAAAVDQIDGLRSEPGGDSRPQKNVQARTPASQAAPPAESRLSNTTELSIDRPLPEKSAAGGTVRIATAKLDRLLLQVEEMLSLKLNVAQRDWSLASCAPWPGSGRGPS